MTTLRGENTAPVAKTAPSSDPATELALPASAPKSGSPLITAVEIENFKGIGRPVRIDLRPLTLLFGRNSAGKSTILHAICYAHEILSHRNLDPRKVEHGGDQVDLGGFQNLVHGHDLERVVRFRFALNLEHWSVPDRLLEKMARPELSESVDPGIAAAFADWVFLHARGELARTGWVEIGVGTGSGVRPRITLYEVGVNEALVGRVLPGRMGDELEFNWAHPLFAPLHEAASVRPPAGVRRAASDSLGETSEELHRAAVIWGSASGLPSWNENLDVDDDSLAADGIVDPRAAANASYAQFRALITGAVVGIGQTLCDQTAALRYLGPLRRRRPPADVDRGSSNAEGWSDGSAAWSLLERDEPAPGKPGLIDDVSDWLKRHDRLDTGYTLQKRTTIQLSADAAFVSQIRFVEFALGKCRDQNGEIDLARWIRMEATRIGDLIGRDPRDVEVQLRRSGDEASVPTETALDLDVLETELVTSARERYLVLRGLLAFVQGLEDGRPPEAVKDLVRTIARAPDQSTLELVTAEAQLPVRTSDVGVGISQLLPVVVAALDPERPGITAIEQPELHAHPKLQVELGDLFAHAAGDHRVFLLENHSEHLMLRLLRRIEETHNGKLPEGKPALHPEQVSVVYLDQVKGEVQATRLRIDETGEFIDRWPHGFFEERDDELF